MTASEPFTELVPLLLAEKGWSVRKLAREAGVSQSHLSRVLRSADYKTPSIPLMEAVAAALEVAPGRFVEYRERRIAEAVRADPALRDEVYRRLEGRRSR